jgi:hypothetical protein
MYGPIVMYSLIHNSIKLIDESIRKFDKEKIEWVQQVAAGNEDASAEGPAVLQYLREKVETKSLSNR